MTFQELVNDLAGLFVGVDDPATFTMSERYALDLILHGLAERNRRLIHIGETGHAPTARRGK
jgi:hypothetical protein